MVDFLDEKRTEIDARLKELRPVVEEFDRLEKAAAALAGVGAAANGGRGQATMTRRSPTPSAAPKKARARKARTKGGSARRGRPRGSGTRGKQALELVRAKPGITIAKLADSMGIKANYLYRVMPSLEAEGQAVKKDGGWHPTK
jgi:hypothetical protein